MVRPLFTLPIPASRHTVPTRYSFVTEDQNGWSRSLHFQAAWLVVLAGLGLWDLHPVEQAPSGELIAGAGRSPVAGLPQCDCEVPSPAPPDDAEAHSYNVVQRTAYLAVIFVLFPMMIWTGLAMSPAFTSAVPGAVTVLGGRQTARTLHFLLTWALVLFVVVHVTMVAMAGFWSRLRAMITGGVSVPMGSPAVGATTAQVSHTGQVEEGA